MGVLRALHRRADEGMGSRERGSILVLFSLLLTLFLLCCAIVIDVGYWWAAGKKAQIAADACALAAAQELPQTYADIPNCAIVAGQDDYVLANIPDQSSPEPEPMLLSTRVRSPYKSDPNMVEATVRMRVGTFFGRIVGLEWVEVERRAVAEHEQGEAKMAIFAGSTDCSAQKGLYFDGDAINVSGHVHSNGEFTVNGAAPPDHGKFTSGTIAKENCVADTNPDGPPASSAGAQFGSGGEWLPQDGEEIQWPEWFYPADFGWYAAEGTGPGQCTYKGEEIDIDSTHLKIKNESPQPLAADPTRPDWTIIPTGTYCATKHFKISGNNHSGTITALAPLIQVDGSGQDYTPYAFDVLFFTVPNSDNDATNDGPYTLGPPELPPYPPCYPSPALNTELHGELYTWDGIIFNPCGKVHVNSKTNTVGREELVGTIYGFQVHINGDEFNMAGTEDFDQSTNIALVE
jgi:hypothetical protein